MSTSVIGLIITVPQIPAVCAAPYMQHPTTAGLIDAICSVGDAVSSSTPFALPSIAVVLRSTSCCHRVSVWMQLVGGVLLPTAVCVWEEGAAAQAYLRTHRLRVSQLGSPLKDVIRLRDTLMHTPPFILCSTAVLLLVWCWLFAAVLPWP